MVQNEGGRIGGMGDDDIGADGAGGRDEDAGGASTSGDRATRAGVTGRGHETRADGPAYTPAEAAEADVPRSGTPDDLKLGGDKPGLDPDAGAGGSTGGVPGGPGGD
jgi:hypothetical protein